MWRIGPLVVAALLGWTAGWAYVPIYQWAYDCLSLGPGFQGHIFANNMDQDATGLVLELNAVPEHVEWLVLGGSLALAAPVLKEIHLTGQVVSGGLAVVVLPEGLRLLKAAWITATGEVPIDVESPIPRVQIENLEWVVVITVEVIIEILPMPPIPMVYDIKLQAYSYLVRLSAQGTFSPLGEEIVSWTWLWEDGLTQVGPEVIRKFDRPGWYRVTLVVRDASGRERALRRLVFAEWPEQIIIPPVEPRPTPLPQETLRRPAK